MHFRPRYKKVAGNLEFRIVNKAGHLVPMDQPVAALDMLTQFVELHKK
jgi:carboxypeptidase C (cathepsin A)